MADEFEQWLRSDVLKSDEGVWLSQAGRLTPEQVHRLICHLGRLCGLGEGWLTEEELQAMRGRIAQLPEPLSEVFQDRKALLAHVDHLRATLAVARAEVEGLRLLVTDLVHPHGDGSEAAVRLYRAGQEAERARVVGVLQEAAREASPELAIALGIAAGLLIEKGPTS